MNSVAIKTPHRHLIDIEDWCEQRFGPGLYIFEPNPRTWRGIRQAWTVNYTYEQSTFSFRDPEQALLFSLTWL